MPKISIIIPIYNIEKYLCKCIDSVLNQTFIDFELILVNDGSTDNCKDIIESYAKQDNRIITIHQKNMGLSSARNAGLKIAKGDYVRFIDGDDYIPNNSLELLFNEIESNNDTILIVGNYVSVNTDKIELINNFYISKQKYYSLIQYQKDIKQSLSLLCNPYNGAIWNKLFNNKIIQTYNLLFEDGINYCEDSIFLLKYFIICLNLNKNYKIIFLQDPVYYYVRRMNSLSNQNAKEDKKGMYIANKKFTKIFTDFTHLIL